MIDNPLNSTSLFGMAYLTSIYTNSSTDPGSPRVFEMLRQYYDGFEFLPHEHFCPMSVYVRRSNLDDKDSQA